MAEEVHVVGVSDPLRTLSGGTPKGVVEAILSMGETPRRTWILASSQTPVLDRSFHGF